MGVQRQQQQLRRVTSLTVLLALVVSLLADSAAAWSPSSPKTFGGSPTTHSQPRGLRPEKSSRKPNLTEQKMLRNPGTPRVRDIPKKSATQMSQSVLASCDTLPQFPTAHGLLSPEVVTRIEGLESSEHGALRRFVQQYRQNGPLSCLSMLSDPDVLPHLTQAMRDVA